MSAAADSIPFPPQSTLTPALHPPSTQRDHEGRRAPRRRRRDARRADQGARRGLRGLHNDRRAAARHRAALFHPQRVRDEEGDGRDQVGRHPRGQDQGLVRFLVMWPFVCLFAHIFGVGFELFCSAACLSRPSMRAANTTHPHPPRNTSTKRKQNAIQIHTQTGSCPTRSSAARRTRSWRGASAAAPTRG